MKKSGWIKNRNSFYVRGIEGFVKGVYSGSGKLYVLIELANRTNISYDIESAVFITAPTKKANKEIEQEEKVFQPIWSNQPEALQKKETKKLVYAFDKFTIADNKKLLFIAIIACLASSVGAQETNSPYSRYGYGILRDQAVGPSKAMGGIGYGLRHGPPRDIVRGR